MECLTVLRVQLWVFLSLVVFLQPATVDAQVQPFTKHDSALVKKYLEQYEYELNKNKDVKEASRYLNETAFLYWEHNQYASAIRYYEMSLELNRRIQNENGMAMLHNNLGMLHADIGSYQKSYDYFMKTLASRRANKEKRGMISALINLSVVLNNLKRYDESATGLEEALQISRELNDPIQMRSCYGMLSETYEKAGNIERSMYYFGLYRTFHDMIQKEEVAVLKSELREEQLVNEIERQKNKTSTELLQERQKQLNELKNQNASYDEQIEEYDSLTASYYASLTQKELELKLLKKEAELNEAELREKAALADSASARIWFTGLISAIIIVGLLVLCIVIIYSYRKSKRDASQLMKSHIELRQTQEQLVKSEKMAAVGVLTAGIAHEINNPLNFIKNGALALTNHITQQWNGKAEEVKPFMDIINEGVSRCTRIIHSISHVSRAGESMTENCDINEILDNCLVVLGGQVSSKVKVVKEYQTEGVKMTGNEGKLHQAFLNIMANALHAMNGEGTLTLKTYLAHDSVILTIRDTGEGISPEHLRKLGDPFFTTKPPGKGTGLGLFITYSIIEEHLGAIEVNSRVNEFTEFTIQLPLSIKKIEATI